MAVYEKKGEICIWWFPKEFSQSRYGEYYLSGRNSCTLISLILANKIAREREFCTTPEQLPRRAIDIFAAAINDGNAVYHRLEGRIEMQMRESRNLNIPDAIEALQMHRRKKDSFRLHELFFTHLQVDSSKRSYPYVTAEKLTQIFNVGLSLHKEPLVPPEPTPGRAHGTHSTRGGASTSTSNSASNSASTSASTSASSSASTSRSAYPTATPTKKVTIKTRIANAATRGFTTARTDTPRVASDENVRPALTGRFLFVIVIADSRTTTFVFEVPNNVVVFIDSHHHGRNTGAVIAQTTISDLGEMSFWFVNMLDEIYQSKPNLFEISFFSTETIDIPSPFSGPSFQSLQGGALARTIKREHNPLVPKGRIQHLNTKRRGKTR